MVCRYHPESKRPLHRAGAFRAERSGGQAAVAKKRGGTNMDRVKDNVPGATAGMYVILGATGNTGSIIANFLLWKGEKMRRRGAGRGATAALGAQRRGSFYGR